MSFIITVYTNEGIVMASDSRTTYNRSVNLPNGTTAKLIGAQITDTTYKTFICNSHVGLSTCGAADINNIPITGYIEKFIFPKVIESSGVDKMSEDIIDYFSAICPNLATNFIVAGYDKDNTIPKVNRIMIGNKQIDKKTQPIQGQLGMENP